MIALAAMIGSAIVFLAGGLYLAIAMGQEAAQQTSEPRIS
jgi:hypothetical protein